MNSHKDLLWWCLRYKIIMIELWEEFTFTILINEATIALLILL